MRTLQNFPTSPENIEMCSPVTLAVMYFSFYIATSSGSCALAGYTDCCLGGLCHGIDSVSGTLASCTCDAVCGELGTCCEDIARTCPDGEYYIPHSQITSLIISYDFVITIVPHVINLLSQTHTNNRLKHYLLLTSPARVG